ncbi:MAG: 4-hydroxy-3-methylbut-2-enyl diphosphate reductase, partial [Bacteroidota bacterium]
GAAAVVVKDMEEAKQLAKYITGEKPGSLFYEEFEGQYSKGFDTAKDLQRIGVVNQTTMLASDTLAISDFLKQTMIRQYKLDASTVEERFADTRDTLCYATNDNQSAVIGMLQIDADLAIVVGGYNSSNTSHLVELCEEKFPTFFINNESKIISAEEILHYSIHRHQELVTHNYLPKKDPVKIVVTSGASCPDALVEGVIDKLAGFFQKEITEELIEQFL